jgi:hypothetical protein
MKRASPTQKAAACHACQQMVKSGGEWHERSCRNQIQQSAVHGTEAGNTSSLPLSLIYFPLILQPSNSCQMIHLGGAQSTY